MKRGLFLAAAYMSCTLLLSPPSPAQKLNGQEPSAQKPESQQPFDEWLVKAETLTDTLAKDGAELDAHDRALLWARLGAVWWQDDRERARSWMQKAVELITSAPLTENVTERERRLAAGQVIEKVLTPLDEALAAQLKEALAASARRAAADPDASALVEKALLLLETDPARAAALGSESLRLGTARSLPHLLTALRLKEPKLADALFGDALAAAQRGYDEYLIGVLAHVAFPLSFSPGGNPVVPPTALRVQTLQLVAQGLTRAPTSPEEEGAACGLSYLASQMLSQYDRLLPREAPRVRQSVSMCQTKANRWERERVEESSGVRPGVEDSLEAYRKSSDPISRRWHLNSALVKARQQQDYDRAIQILDDITGQERESLGHTWDDNRVTFAVEAAHAGMKKNDYPKMMKVVETTPSHLRPSVQVLLAMRLVHLDKKSAAAIELLESARRGLAKLDSSNPHRAGWAWEIVRLYTIIHPSEVAAVFQEAAEAFDRVIQQEPPDARQQSGPPEEPFAPLSLTPNIFEASNFQAEGLASAVKSPRARALIRLGLLEVALQQRRAQKAQQAGKTVGQ